MTETQLEKGSVLKEEWKYLEKELAKTNEIIDQKGEIQMARGESGFINFYPKSETRPYKKDVLEEVTHGLKIARDLIEMRITHLKEIFNKI